MATRTNITKTLDDVTPTDVLVAMYDEGDNPQEGNPVNITSVALSVNLTDADTFSLLGTIADLTGVIDGQGVNWWFTANYATPDDMVSAYMAAVSVAAKKVQEAPKKRAAKKTTAKPVQAAVEPQESVTGLTRAEVIESAREVVSAPVTPVSVPAAFLGQEYESDIVKHGLALDEPEFIPALTDAAIKAGVSENEWYMMYAAITQTARDWWTKRVSAKIEAADGPTSGIEPHYAVAPATQDEAGF